MKTKSQSMIVSVVLLFVGTFVISQSGFGQNENHLGVADYLDFEQVNDAQISPGGRQIIYTRRWVDQKADSWASALWISKARS